MAARQIEANIRAATRDPWRRIDYRKGGSLLNALPWVLILIAIGFAMLVFDAGDGKSVLAAVVLLVLLPVLIAMDLWRLRPSAPPGLVLSAEGLALHVRGWGWLGVPWSAIEAIDTRSFEGFALRLRGRQRIVFDDVTMIRLVPGFLAAARASGDFVPGGPTVDWIVRPDAKGEWIALHHEIYSLTPAEVRAPVEARWSAFHQSDPDAPQPAGTTSGPLRLGGSGPRTRFFSRSERLWACAQS